MIFLDVSDVNVMMKNPKTLTLSFCCFQTRPTPPHLTSAMAENILAAACESESRNAAKRMRLEAYHVSSCGASTVVSNTELLY